MTDKADSPDVIPAAAPESAISSRSKAAFIRYAKADEETGDLYLGEDEFINLVAPKDENFHKIQREQYRLLFEVADRQQKGRVSLQDWASYENLLSRPDGEYEIAFRLFDHEGTGYVKFESFLERYNKERAEDSLPFVWNSEWTKLYTGGRNKRHDMTYHQFSQMLRGLQGERVRQAFQHFDKDGDGYIEPEQFQRIILQTAGHKLSDHLLDNLQSLCNVSAGSKISYANVRAFQNMIREMDLVELVVKNAASKSKDGKISRADFLNEASRTTRFSLLTPMEADILFHFAGMDEPSGQLGLAEFAKVLDASWTTSHRLSDGIERISDAGQKAFASSESVLRDVMQSVYHFALGSVAGAFGAFMVYPIDLVKTRMQNQRGQGVGTRLYKNSLDCFQKVLRNEGVRGLYSGVFPQLIGVAPEKAIKLTVNDLVRGKFINKKTGEIDYKFELLAGGSAGACQVIFTNPLEIVKIRLQVQGELAKSPDAPPRRSALWIMRNLGLRGLYKGASACLMRDVPFSAIYFPTYSHLKKDYFGESPEKKLGVLQLLTAGAIAGMPAAYLTTPFDVIKTRLQVEARKGEQSYTTLRHCAKTIFQQEGFQAFFKGGPARIMRSSPQFGFTLAGYEVLQSIIPMPGQSAASASALDPPDSFSTDAFPYLRSRNALKIILDLDENFGRPKLPKSNSGSAVGYLKPFGG